MENIFGFEKSTLSDKAWSKLLNAYKIIEIGQGIVDGNGQLIIRDAIIFAMSELDMN